MSAELERGRVTGDVFIRETDDAAFSRESKTITNSSGDDMVLPAGYPMDDNVPVIAANIANCDGLLLESVTIADGEVRMVAVVQRGSIVINQDALPTVDYVGASINMTNFATAVAALDFVVRREPQNQAELET
jgi:hypothetical protein